MRTAIVTGASKGIGKATAEELAFNRYNIALISRHYSELNNVVEELRDKVGKNWGWRRDNEPCFIAYQCDISKKDEVKNRFSEIYDKFGNIDILVNNAGINSRKSLDASNVDKWFDSLEDNLDGFDKEIDINLRGSFICSYIAAGYMLKNERGNIVNISSVKGIEPTTSLGYGASKAGLIKMTKDFARALGPYGIKVNCVSPGFIDCGMTSEISDEKKADYRKKILNGRFGSVGEVAKTVAFLVSDDSNYITGENINVNGGYLMI